MILNSSLAADLDYTWVIMMGHYFYLLAIVNRHVFMCMAGTFEKYTKEIMKNNQELENSSKEPRMYSSTLILFHNIGIWLCIRYHYHLPFLLLIQNIIHVFEPITYFYNFYRTGT